MRNDRENKGQYGYQYERINSNVRPTNNQTSKGLISPGAKLITSIVAGAASLVLFTNSTPAMVGSISALQDAEKSYERATENVIYLAENNPAYVNLAKDTEVVAQGWVVEGEITEERYEEMMEEVDSIEKKLKYVDPEFQTNYTKAERELTDAKSQNKKDLIGYYTGLFGVIASSVAGFFSYKSAIKEAKREGYKMKDREMSD